MISIWKWKLRIGFIASLLFIIGGIAADSLWGMVAITDDEAARVVGGACPVIEDKNCGTKGTTNNCDAFQGIEESLLTKGAKGKEDTSRPHYCGTRCGYVTRIADACGSS